MKVTMAALATQLAELLLTRVSRRAKKQDVLKATIEEMAQQFILLEARVARLERFTNLLDTDQDEIPDMLESLVQSRTKAGELHLK